MKMKLFYKCNFLEEDFVEAKKFTVTQAELLAKHKISDKKHSFYKKSVSYNCQWKKQSDWSSEKPTIIIPIRDAIELLTKTLNNLIKHNLAKHCNIIIVDDRSMQDIEQIVLKYGLSYLRVDNDKGFNFSMLNNIAAKICHSLGIKDMVLWNSDLWCVKEEYFLELLKRHIEGGSALSGTKLIYPPKSESLNKEDDTLNIQQNFSGYSKKWRETIQFGGDYWVLTPSSPILMSPIHYGRFRDKEDKRFNCDRGATFVTGAMQIWNVQKFIDMGGFNPSLAKNFQDVDIALLLLESGNSIMYYGEDIYFYHDESYSLAQDKYDHQMASDHTLFAKIWNSKIASLLFN